MSQIKKYVVVPLRETVLFPGMVTPVFVGRTLSVESAERATEKGLPLLFVTQKNPQVEHPTMTDLFTVGTTVEVLQYLKLPTGTLKILTEATGTARIESFYEEDGILYAEGEPLEHRSKEPEALLAKQVAGLMGLFGLYARISRNVPSDAIKLSKGIQDLGALYDLILAHLEISLVKQQQILSYPSTAKRLEKFSEILQQRISTIKLDQKLQNRVKTQMDRNQKEFYLHEKMKAIQKELGEEEQDLDAYEKELQKGFYPKHVKEKAKSEIKRLKQMSPMSAEATVARNYLEWIFDLPWAKKNTLKNDLNKAQEILDADHYGLEKVKERILEYLTVQKRTGKTGGTVLCFVGSPGVGKTSLGQSIARAVGREFQRISLGGVRDSSDIRGHRRTYIGSQPGRIMSALKKAKSNNPLIMLDEIDKMSRDWQGDPSSALLEVLDPSQNKAFNDHYIELDYDLSSVMFITTANTLDISAPLLDRMEVIRLSGYTEQEKLEIAKRYLLPKQLKSTGLKESEIEVGDQALIYLIRRYTQEAGVRSLERAIAKVLRKVLRKIDSEKEPKVTITETSLPDFLGPEIYDFGQKDKVDQVGTVNGLAWTEMGGDMLSIEAVQMPGKGKFMLTGKLGDVMKESIETAKSFVRSRAYQFGIMDDVFEKTDIHIHLPEGSIPKDGPSAGVGMATAIVSTLTDIPVSKNVAMTGEVTLQGHVLPIGGLKEKLLAALRAGIQTVIIPEKNKKDLKELPEVVINNLKIIPVKTIDEVLKVALTKSLNPLPLNSHVKECENKCHA